MKTEKYTNIFWGDKSDIKKIDNQDNIFAVITSSRSQMWDPVIH